MKHLLLILLLTISPAACQTLSAPAANALLSYNFARCIAVDDAGRVHVTWYETDRGLVKYRRSVNGAWHDEVVLSGPDAACPAIAVGAGEVLVAWHETTSGRPSVMLRRSTDGGATWAAASSLASGAHVSIAASGQRVLAAWCASPEGQSEIYARRSVDGGRTWDAARRMTDLPHDSWVPSVAVDGENGYLAWVDLRDGNEEEYFKRSTDGGRTWGPDTRVTRNPANSWAPSVAARGDDVYLAWFDQCDSKVDCAQAEEMLNEAMRMVGLPTEPVPTGVYQEMRPATPHQRCEAKWKIASAAIPGWLEKGGDPSRLQPQVLQLQALMDPPAPDAQKEEKLDEILRLLGVPFNPNMKIVSYYEAAIRQRIQDKVEKIQRAAPDWVRGGGDPRRLDAALKSFMARLTEATTEWEVYFQRSTDRGASWSKPVRLSNAAGLSQRPSIAVEGNTLHVAWFDGREGKTQIYYRRSNDGGRSWSPETRLSNGPGDAAHPSVAGSHVIWHATVDGRSHIEHARISRKKTDS